ncbi:MAG: Gmad2 immunoglobulin-like domain-containing protein [Chloroflexota bacterium]
MKTRQAVGLAHLLLALLLVTSLVFAAPASAQTRPPDYDLPNGHFFTQTNGDGGESGFPVVDARLFNVALPFWNEFRRLGGVDYVGYPISQVFFLDGFLTQVFQKAVFQWQPGTNQVFFVNVFDVLHDRGYDDYLAAVRSTPRPLGPEFDAGKTWDQIVADRLALLNANPAIRQTYYSVQNPLLRFGLPTSRVVDMGNHFVIRLQRAVLQQWKVAVPWAAPGQVTIANGGAIAMEVGLFPDFAIQPLPRPNFSTRVVNYLPGSGQTVSSGFRIRGDAQVFEAVLSYRLLAANGQVLAEGFTMTNGGAPAFGRYEANINFNVASRQATTLQLFERSAEDGSIVQSTLVNVPLTLAP